MTKPSKLDNTIASALDQIFMNAGAPELQIFRIDSSGAVENLTPTGRVTQPGPELQQVKKMQDQKFDHTKPFRTRDGRKAKLVSFDTSNTIIRVLINDDEVVARWKDDGTANRNFEGPGDLVNITEQTDHVRRSLRPDAKAYKLRDGRPVKILSWDEDDEAPIVVSYPASAVEQLYHPRRKTIVAQRHKNGRIYPAGGDTLLDVLEVREKTVKWVRMYDEKKVVDPANPAKQLVGPARNKVAIGVAIPAHMYLFDTEVEARAQMQGVRAVFPIEYEEGQGCA